MRAVWLGGSNTAPSTSAVNYYALTGDLEHTPTPVELARANILTDDVEITSIAAIVGNAPGSGKSWTLTLRNGGANTAAAVTISGTDQSAVWTGSATCLADTRLGLSITPSGTPAAIGSIRWVITYQTAGNFYLAFSGRMSAPSGTLSNQYIGFNGAHDNAPSSSITASAELAPTGYAVTKLGMAMGGSSVLNGATVRCGKQGMATVSSSLAFVSADGQDAIGTLGTPLHVDAGETAQIHLAAGGSLPWTPYLFSATIAPDIVGEQILSYSDTAVPSTTVTQYVGPSGENNGAWNATESVVALRAPACRVTKLAVQQVTAPGSGKSRDYALRQNGGYAGLTATVAGTATDAVSPTTGAAPAIASVGTYIPYTSGLTTAAIPVPSGVSATPTDIVVVFLFLNTAANPTVTPPLDFVEVPNSPLVNAAASKSFVLHMYWRRATAADAGTYNFTWSGPCAADGFAFRMTGCVATGNPFDVTAQAISADGSASAYPAVSVTTTAANELLLWIAANYGGYDSPLLSGFTESFDNEGQVLQSKAQAVAGSSGSLTAAWTGSVNSASAWAGAVKPTAAATPAYLLGDLLSIEQKPTGTPAATAGVKISLVLLLDQNVSGAVAATMVAATASLNGQVVAAGVMAATLRPPSIALAGQNSQSGALAATMRTMALALTGSQQINGTMVLALRAAVAQLVGSGNANGTMAATMQRLIAQLDGDTTSGEIAVTLRRLIASVNGSQAVRGVLAATMRQLLFSGTGSAGSQASITASLRAPSASLVGIVVDVVAPPALPAVQFKVARAMPNPQIVSPTQIVALRTAAGTQIAQYRGDQQTNLTWSREAKETSRCELTVQSDMTYTGRIPDIQPWAHWADVWDDTGQLLLWSGPVVKMVANRDQVVISARDLSAYGSRTRVPITKRWDAIDPALVAGEMYRYMLEHHNLDAQAIVRPDPLGDRYDFKTTADDGQVDKVIEDLVGLGMTWTVVNGTPILGPVSRRPVASLGERDFVGGGLTITRDGTNSYNDILLRSGSDQARAIVPMGGLALQQTVDIDSVFGVSNTNKATLSYAQYVGKIRDMLSLSDGVVLHPASPISIEELIPGARVFIEAYGIIFTMGLTRVEVTTSAGASQVSVGMEAVDDELPELVELQAKRYTGGADL